jgi:hypothetical protein
METSRANYQNFSHQSPKSRDKTTVRVSSRAKQRSSVTRSCYSQFALTEIRVMLQLTAYFNLRVTYFYAHFRRI